MSDSATNDHRNEEAQLKLVVSNASEAVTTIKERFGEQARVLSVKQSESSGLKGFLQKPRLEVIVAVPRWAIERQPERKQNSGTLPEASNQQPQTSSEPVTPDVERSATDREQGESLDPKPAESRTDCAATATSKLGYFADALDEEEPEAEAQNNAEESAPLGSAANLVSRGTMEQVKRVTDMLRSVGFDDSLIERIRYELDFRSMGQRSTAELYGAVCEWLHRQFPAEKPRMSGKRRAFIGSCGVGKTSALCKAVSADVFINGLQPQVLKVDGDVPNPSDGLETFCDIMGAPFARALEDVDAIDEGRPLFVDVPGVRYQNEASIEACREILEELDVEERVLVVNAAYDAETIAEAMVGGERLGANAVVFTHLDEARRPGKLWRFALSGKFRLLFFSHGPNPAGEYTQDAFSALLAKTFPHGNALAGSESRRRQNHKRGEVAAA